MAFIYETHVRPLYSFTDEEINAIVTLYASYILSVNQRKLVAIDVWYEENGDESMLHFRLSTVPDCEQEQVSPEKFVSGFQLLFYTENQDDLYFSPITTQNYYAEWLELYGINEPFVFHRLGILKVRDFFSDRLKLWNNTIAYTRAANQHGKLIAWRNIPIIEMDVD